MRIAQIILLFLLPTVVSAAEQSTRVIEPLSNTNLTKWTLGLFAILLLIAGLAWLVKRFSKVGFKQVGKMQILSGLSLGNREKVVLMKAGRTHLLLGVTSSQIQTLHVFEKGEINEAENEPELSFSDSLQRVIRKKTLS